MLNSIKTLVAYLHREEGNAWSFAFSCLLLAPVWMYVFNIYAPMHTSNVIPEITWTMALLGMPILSLIFPPLGIAQLTLFQLLVAIINRLLNKPRIIAD